MQHRSVMKLRAQDIQKKINSGEIRVVYAKSSRTETLRPWVTKVLEAIGHPEAFITDESTIRDFFIFDSDNFDDRLAAIGKKLGTSVKLKDRVMDVANRIRIGQMS